MILSYVFYILGTVEFVLSIIPGKVRNFLWGTFGVSALLVGIALMVLGVVIYKKGLFKTFLFTLAGLVIFIIASSAYFQNVFAGFPTEGGFKSIINTIINDGRSFRGGGFFALFLGWAGKLTSEILMALGFILMASSIILADKLSARESVDGFTFANEIELPDEPEKKERHFIIPKLHLGKKKEDKDENYDVNLDDIKFENSSSDNNDPLFNAPTFNFHKPETINITKQEEKGDFDEIPLERALRGYKIRSSENNLPPSVLPKEPKTETVEPKFSFASDFVPVVEEKTEEKFEDNIRTTTAFSNFNPYNVKAVEKDKDSSYKKEFFKEVEEEKSEFVLPALTLLNPVKQKSQQAESELRINAEKLVSVLTSFGVQTRVTNISRGPAVTRYELLPEAGVRISKITGLSDDIALNLAATSVRIEAPIPGKSAIGIEIPNRIVDSVGLKEVIESDNFKNATAPLTVALGKDIAGEAVVADINKMPHVLIAGTTGSGKSVCINSIIISLLYRCTPDEVKFLMIDPKIVELGVYNGMPHLAVPVVSDPKKAAGALAWAVKEMENRYQLFFAMGARDMASYNRIIKNHKMKDDEEAIKPMPHYVIIIDELADLMAVAGREVENSIQRLAQKARAAGMHLVIATQRPSVDVITGVIKANVPSRIAFAVSSQIDSRTILDEGGAEKLLGRGDMLFSPVGAMKPTRVQGCFVSDEEIERVKEAVSQNGSDYDETIENEIEKCIPVGKGQTNGSGDAPSSNEDTDPMLDKCIEVVLDAGMASTSLLQRKCALGYARAARIIDEMEARGIVGPFEGSKPRPVLLTRERWLEMKLNKADNETNG